MAAACRVIGVLLVLLGLGLSGVSALQMRGDSEYQRAALVAQRNPGNVLYEAEFKGAQVRRAFQAVGAFGGILLALNGITLLLLGRVAARPARES